MTTPELDIIKDLPGYKLILKAVVRSQIQQLVEQLSAYADEESIILTASLTEGTLSHVGSESGKSFLDNHEDVKAQFLGFCLKYGHERSESNIYFEERKDKRKRKKEPTNFSLMTGRDTPVEAFSPTVSQSSTSAYDFNYLMSQKWPQKQGTGGHSKGNRHQPYQAAGRSHKRCPEYCIDQHGHRAKKTERNAGSISDEEGEAVPTSDHIDSPPLIKIEAGCSDNEEQPAMFSDDSSAGETGFPSHADKTKSTATPLHTSRDKRRISKDDLNSNFGRSFSNDVVKTNTDCYTETAGMAPPLGHPSYNMPSLESGSKISEDYAALERFQASCAGQRIDSSHRPFDAGLGITGTGIKPLTEENEEEFAKKMMLECWSNPAGKSVGGGFDSATPTSYDTAPPTDFDTPPTLGYELTESVAPLGQQIETTLPMGGCKPDVRGSPKKFECDVCRKYFPENWQLIRHYRIHTGEKPYRCKICDRSFAVSSNLRSHMHNMHTIRKPKQGVEGGSGNEGSGSTGAPLV